MEQIRCVLQQDVDYLILREKDLTESAYENLAKQVLKEAGERCVLHSFIDVAIRLGCRKIHLPMEAFLKMTPKQKACFSMIGVSTHTVEEALLAEKNKADYITASHIFPTDCKKGLPPKGLVYLKAVCQKVQIPVYALGGISKENIKDCINAGADGVCMMKTYMRLSQE